MIRRRQFITLFGGAAAWPIAARGQQTTKLPIIGFMNQLSREEYGANLAGFHAGLREQGLSKART